MENNKSGLIRIIKQLGTLIVSIVLILLGFKLAIFYMPFLISFIFYLLIEPVIKKLMVKFSFKRKTSSLIILVIAISLAVLFLVWGIVTIITESSNLLSHLNEYVKVIQDFIVRKTESIDLKNLQLPDEIIGILNQSGQDIVSKGSEIVRNFLTNLLNRLTSIPSICFCTVITIMSLYFFATDKIYMLDQLEHHLPKKWVRGIAKHISGIAKSLGGYLKAQLTLIVISFIISLIGLYIYKFIGLDVKYPFLAAVGIGFIDALPILGSGTVMIPWAIIAACKGNIKLGIAILCLWLVMTIIRQIIEPKIVSGKLGVHPIFTLIAMYTGFKFIGLTGLFIGPIVLIILKNIFESRIDKGIVKSIIE